MGSLEVEETAKAEVRASEVLLAVLEVYYFVEGIEYVRVCCGSARELSLQKSMPSVRSAVALLVVVVQVVATDTDRISSRTCIHQRQQQG